MSHSLIGAGRGTHCKIVAVALAGAAILMVAVGAALHPSRDGSKAQASAPTLVIKAGKPTVSAANDASLIR